MGVVLRSTVLVLVLAVCAVSPARAQEVVTVTGKVTTAVDGQSLPGATVSIASLKLSAETGPDGS